VESSPQCVGGHRLGVVGDQWGGPEAIGRSPACDATLAPSDAILVENFNADFLRYKRASELRRKRLVTRVLVLTWTNRGTEAPNDVALGIVQVVAKIGRIGAIKIVPTREAEPITLNAARDVQRFLERERIRSVIVVTPLFRSRRSALLYAATLGRADPVYDARVGHSLVFKSRQ